MADHRPYTAKPRAASLARIRADLIFRERQPGEAAFEPVQWQMPEAVFRQFQRAARRQGTEVNTLVRDFVCAALTERVEAITQHNAVAEREADEPDAEGGGPVAEPPAGPNPVDRVDSAWRAADSGLCGATNRPSETAGSRRPRPPQAEMSQKPSFSRLLSRLI